MEEESNFSPSDSPSELPDRLSELPDYLIHHILSFLPTTSAAICTGLLSKRWRNQWRQVPVLIFTSSVYKRHSKAINDVLDQYESSNLEKFNIVCVCQDDPHFDRRIRFAISRHVKELILDTPPEFKLPEILFSHASLLKLHANHCLLAPYEKVNWKNLKELKAIHCKFLDRGIEHILSGCHLLESLTLSNAVFDRLTIASQSLRKMTLKGLRVHDDIALSCPNLEELDLQELYLYARNNGARGDVITVLHPTVRYTTKGVLAVTSESLRKLHVKCPRNLEISCPNLLELYLQELYWYAINNDARGDAITVLHPTVRYTTKGVLAVTSESLRKLHVKCPRISRLEISCPMLEELVLYGSIRGSVKVVLNLNPSVVTFSLAIEDFSRTCMELLLQLQHVKELKFVRRFVNTSSGLDGWEKSNRPTRLLSNKHVTLDYPCFNEIELALLVFHVLEKLVVKFPSTVWRSPIDFLELDDADENYWSKAPYLNCVASHLKYVELIFIKTYRKHKRALSFIEFLLKKAGVLKKMVIVFKNCDKGFAMRVSRKAATFPRISQDAVVEFSRLTLLDFESEDLEYKIL